MIDNLKDGPRIVSGIPVNAERKRTGEDFYNLTPFEGLLMGGSDSIIVKGKEASVDDSSLQYLMRDADARRAILSPLNVVRGNISLEEVTKARAGKQMEFSPFISTVFESKRWFKYPAKDIRLSFRPGKLDETGLLTEFELYPTKNGQKMELSEISPEDQVLSEEFKHVINFLGEENNKLKFRIKSEREIKDEASNDLTPFEHSIMGSSQEVTVNGKKINIALQDFGNLQKDQDVWGVILTPGNLTEGNRTLEGVRQARAHANIKSGIVNLFERRVQLEYGRKGMYLTLMPGDLDENGKLKTLGFYFVQNGQKINLPEKASEEIVIEERFKNLVKYIEDEDGVMKFRIKSEEEIKRDAALNVQM